MKKRTKVAIVAGVIVAVLGAVVLLASLALSEWNFDLGNNWEQDTFRSYTAFSKVFVKASAGKVVLKPELRDSVEVNYDYNDRFKPSFEEKSDTLRIETGERKWYDISYWFNDAPTIEIIIPMQLKAEVYLVVDAGTVDISGIWGPLIDLELNAGAVTMNSLAVDRLNIELNAGAVSMGVVVVNELDIEVNAGALQAKKMQCKTINCEISAGGLEADEITCELFEGKVSAGGLNVKKMDGQRMILNVSAGAANLGMVGAKSEYNVSVRKTAGSCNVSSTGGGYDFTHVLFIYLSAGSVEVTFGN